MSKTSLFGRRIHIAGSVSKDPLVAPKAEVERARKLIELLVPRLVERGATFVLPIDKEKTRDDGLPICFDWLVLRVLNDCMGSRPADAPEPYAVAVQHHKTEKQIPRDLAGLWQDFRNSGHVDIRNIGHWDMYSKRMEAQASRGDVLIALGGMDGVLNLANLYHDAGKPVIPLNLPITPSGAGARRLFDDVGLSVFNSSRLFRTKSRRAAHEWMAQISFMSVGRTSEQQVADVLRLLDSLEPPRAFVVRLMNEMEDLHSAVSDLFDLVVYPVVKEEYGYELVVVDGSQPYTSGTIPQDIFEKLHRSQVVVVDLTGMRPNCLVELGYALGRGLPTMMLAQDGEKLPFDIQGIPIYYWKSDDPVDKGRAKFREYWTNNIDRPHLVATEMLVE